eukprot:gnl/MRDRNA2_/MRDRNA2_101058_c0_seq1.p1 gnl/MRDRNA2_/MRDRNA2_101058_c0~~gnl/MRDRNA2_/MRDRNA2_101058_c0_seq1.p1  ORF type:complete len:271 (+),score=67.22 gnl/MRDRNA2_/MRDRNA2_101058_c0_seq1:78-890(+)
MLVASAIFFLLSAVGEGALRRSQPVIAHVPSTLAELKDEENKLVDKLFVVASDTVLTELTKIKQTRTQVKTSAAAPAGAPGGAPGKPPFGMPKKAYMGIKPEMKAKTGPIFQLKCAELLDQMVNTRVVTLAKLGLTNETVGIDMATHFQVQCPGSIPMPEDKCDDHATKLAKLIDSGKPIFIPPPPGPAGAPGAPGAPGAAPAAALIQMHSKPALIAAPAGAPGAPGGPGAGGIKSGNDWCDAFFAEFFDAIVAQVAAAGPAGAPGAPAR